MWDESIIRSYITEGNEENSQLEYKAAAALKKTSSKKSEIRKDVSAMANSAGGIIIYGVDEFSDKSKAHLPQKIAPVKRSEISREWLDQVISHIKPPIKDFKIFPVDIGTDPDDVVYVVYVPKGITAHQADDGKYYRRRNTTTAVLEHYEIVDIMNREIIPDVVVHFKWKYTGNRSSDLHTYILIISIENLGPLVNHFQLDFTFSYNGKFLYNGREVQLIADPNFGKLYSKRVIINSENVLFPKQVVDISDQRKIKYSVNHQIYHSYSDHSPIINWTLFADQMQPKSGIVEFQDLNNF